MLENRVLRRILRPKWDEVTGEWRNLHKEELSDLYSPPIVFGVIKSRIMRWKGHVSRTGERRGVYSVLVGKPEGKNDWEDRGIDGRIILKKDLQEVRCGGNDQIELAQDGDRWRTLVNGLMNLRVP